MQLLTCISFALWHATDRIFDTCNSTQDVYDEFGKPVVLSAMDGMNGNFRNIRSVSSVIFQLFQSKLTISISFLKGTLFAYGQTSSGKTYTMLGDQNAEGVIPKAIGEIYEYIEQVHPEHYTLIILILNPNLSFVAQGKDKVFSTCHDGRLLIISKGLGSSKSR